MENRNNIRHVVIDMQRLVAEQTAWYTPVVMRILPKVLRLATALRERTLYARFVAPYDEAAAHGNWKAFYRRWPMITARELDPALIELVEPLAALANPEQVFDKLGYSIFSAPDLDPALQKSNVGTLILSGIETDVCVYASALQAIDLGYFVVLVEDALASPDEEAHRAVIDRLARRLPDQIAIMAMDEVLATYAPPGCDAR